MRSRTVIRRPRGADKRHAAALIETALLLPLLLLTILGSLDLFLMAFRQNVLAVAAKDLARQVSISGADQPTALQTWGPAAVSTNGASLAPDQAYPLYLLCMPPSDIAVDVSWPDGNHWTGSRVIARMTFEHHSLLGGLAPWSGTQLTASCEFLVIN